VSGCRLCSQNGGVPCLFLCQERVDGLADRAKEGLLTDDERAEYEALVNASDFIAILKLKASHALESNPPGD
jgi:hypothetical protein